MSVMDVQIEPQIQLLSRLQLTVDCQSRLCFLHGDSGVGKSHLANMLSEQAVHYCIRLNYRASSNPVQVKHQLICELASDEFSDLEQPLLTAIQQRIASHQQSVLIIVDNASELPQADIAMLWHAVHDFSRQHSGGANFSVVLVGETQWAMPLFKALDKKEHSLVAEFHLKPLSRKHAREFMTEVHSQWPEGKIEQFLKGVRNEHLLPKQLIYAQLGSEHSRFNKKLLITLISAFILFLVAMTLGAYFSQSLKSNDDIKETVAPKHEEVSQTPVITSSKELPLDNDEVGIAVQDGLPELPISQQDVDIQETALEVTKPAKKPEALMQQEPTPIVNVESAEVVKLPYDGELLLQIADSNYALMLGGYAERDTFERTYAQLSDYSQVYQYKTIRNGKPWYVILYGSFDSKAEANKALLDLPNHVSGFLPWSKPYTSIHQEIGAFASTKDRQ